MSDAIDQSLSNVHALIEAEKLSEARIVLEPLLETNKGNIDVWWLYAHAVEDSASARTALGNVLRLDPEYPGASKLMQALERKESGQASALDDASADDFVLDDEDLDFDDFDEDFEDEIQKPAGRRKLLMRLGGLLVLVTVIVVAALVVTSLGKDDDPTEETPTTAAQVAITNTPWPVASPEVTDAPVETAPPTETGAPTPPSEFEVVVNALEGLDLFEPPNELTETAMGATLLVSVCTDNSGSIRDTLNTAMMAMASVHSEMAEDVEAFGVRLMYCGTEDIINVIAVSRSDADAFADGTITDAEFPSRWRPVG